MPSPEVVWYSSFRQLIMRSRSWIAAGESSSISWSCAIECSPSVRNPELESIVHSLPVLLRICRVFGNGFPCEDMPAKFAAHAPPQHSNSLGLLAAFLFETSRPPYKAHTDTYLPPREAVQYKEQLHPQKSCPARFFVWI